MLKMYTTTWCPDCRRAKRFLADHGIAVEEINIEEVPGAAELVAERNQGRKKVPTFDRDGHFFHCSPYDPAILRRELSLAPALEANQVRAATAGSPGSNS